jgi:hypothetical protein
MDHVRRQRRADDAPRFLIVVDRVRPGRLAPRTRVGVLTNGLAVASRTSRAPRGSMPA